MERQKWSLCNGNVLCIYIYIYKSERLRSLFRGGWVRIITLRVKIQHIREAVPLTTLSIWAVRTLERPPSILAQTRTAVKKETLLSKFMIITTLPMTVWDGCALLPVLTSLIFQLNSIKRPFTDIEIKIIWTIWQCRMNTHRPRSH